MSESHPEAEPRAPQEADGLVRALAAVICRDGRYLVCRRPAHKRHGGLWEFPGGKLEPGESLLEAARRELAEELHLEVVSVAAPVFARHDPGSRFVIEFSPVEVRGDPDAHEHEEIRWVTAAELLSLPLAPTDRAFSEACLRSP